MSKTDDGGAKKLRGMAKARDDAWRSWWGAGTLGRGLDGNKVVDAGFREFVNWQAFEAGWAAAKRHGVLQSRQRGEEDK